MHATLKHLFLTFIASHILENVIGKNRRKCIFSLFLSFLLVIFIAS